MNTFALPRFKFLAARGGTLALVLALLVTSLGIPTGSVLAVPTAGGFMAHPTAPVFGALTAESLPNDVQLGDVDNDGDLDVLLVQFLSADPDTIWLNDGSGVFTLGATLGTGVDGNYGDSQSGYFYDFNADGWLDVAITNFLNDTTLGEFIWLNNGNGGDAWDGFTLRAMFNALDESSSPIYFTRNLLIGNIDGVAGLELIAVQGFQFPMKVYSYNGSGTPSFVRDITRPATEYDAFYHSVLVNVDNLDDSDLDIVLSTSDGLFIMKNDGAGLYPSASQTHLLADVNTRVALPGDLDGDGDLDLLVGMNNATRVFFNDGHGVFTMDNTSSRPLQWEYSAIHDGDSVLGDIDDDGDLDVFMVNEDEANDYFFLNDGTGVFTENDVTASVAAGEFTRGARFGDLDGDDDLDLVTIASGDGVRVWLNNVAPITSDYYMDAVPINTTITFEDADFLTHYVDVDPPVAPAVTTLESIQITQLPTSGALRLNTTAVTLNQVIPLASLGNLNFVPPTGFNGSASFQWRAWDGNAYSNASLVTMTFGGPNTPPTTTDITMPDANENVTTTFSAATFTPGHYSDPEGQPMASIQVVTLPAPATGTLRLNGTPVAENDIIPTASLGNFTFVPTPGWYGTTSFTFRASDGSIFSNISTLTMTYLNVNVAPVAASFTKAAVDEDGANVTFSAADFNTAPMYTDADGDPLASIRITALPAAASGVLSAGTPAEPVEANDVILAADLGTLVFDPAANWNGSATFSWQANDGLAYSNTATVTMPVTAVQDVPVTENFTVNTNEDTTYNFTQADFTGHYTDADSEALVNVRIVSLPAPAAGVLNLNTTAITANQVIPLASLGSINFVPTANWNGNATFTWQASDGHDYSEADTVTISVTAVNDLPVITPLTKTAVDEDTTVTFTATDFTDHYSDAEGTALVEIRITALPASAAGTLRLSGTPVALNQVIPAANLGNLTFVPAANWNGSATFSWQASDGTGYSTASTVTMPITAVQDVPVTANFTVNTNEDTTYNFTQADFTGHYTDADSEALVNVRIVSLPAPAAGVLNLSTTAITAHQVIPLASLGSINFVPEANWNGDATFTWQAYDGHDYSEADTVTVHVAAVNDEPQFVGLGNTSGDEETLITFVVNASDVETPAASLIFGTSGSLPSGATFTPATRTFSWTPTEAQGANGTAGDYTVTFTVNDGTITTTQTITIHANEVNVAPVVNDNIADQNANEGSPFSLNLNQAAYVTDADRPNNTLTFTLDSTVGSLTSAGVFTWTPTESDGPGTFTVNFTVSDGALTDTGTFDIVVAEVNQPPALTAPVSGDYMANIPLSIVLTATDADVPANALTFGYQGSLPAGASYNAATHTFTWTPTLAQLGPHTVTFTVNDGTTTVTVDVVFNIVRPLQLYLPIIRR